MHVEMDGWCREWKEGHVDMAVCAENQRGADGNGWFVQKGKEVHVVNGWLAQKPKRHAYGNWWLVQTYIDMDVGMYGWCRDQETCQRPAYGQCMVGAETHRNGCWRVWLV